VLPYRSEKTVKGVALTLIDVDTLKRAERSLAEAVKDREGFLAVLSHELRNPVNAVLSASHLLESHPDAVAQDQATAVIQRQSKHIARLLEDLLDVSRMTQNKLELRMNSFDLRKAIDAAIETANPAIIQHGQLLKADLPSTPMFVYGDEHRLSQVVVNLMVNAAKYSPTGGTVRLVVKPEKSEVLIKVIDNGNGIPADSLESIFKPFNQSSRTRRNRDGGMGVGLSLAKSIVERHFGRIKAHSDGEGKGSEFSVKLPLISPPVEDRSHPKTSQESLSKGLIKRKCGPVRRVVVVEDQSDNREMLRKILRMKGYEVKVAKDGEEGIELIVNERPQAAIVDLGLPTVNGYGVAKNVRARLGDQILMIALTGHGSPEDIEAAMEAGFDDHMVKPLDLERLHTLLQAQT
jgi:nitrogen-specific signal transduction histidine kinase